jgi:response regulator of citrate/malate metabolism
MIVTFSLKSNIFKKELQGDAINATSMLHIPYVLLLLREGASDYFPQPFRLMTSLKKYHENY